MIIIKVISKHVLKDYANLFTFMIIDEQGLETRRVHEVYDYR